MVSVGKLVGGFIVIIVGLILTPMVANEVKTAQDNANITGSLDTLLDLVPFMWVIAIIGIAVGLGVSAFRAAD